MFLGGTRPLPCLAIHSIQYSQRVWPNCSGLAVAGQQLPSDMAQHMLPTCAACIICISSWAAAQSTLSNTQLTGSPLLAGYRGVSYTLQTALNNKALSLSPFTFPYRRSISTTASLTGWLAVSKVERQNSGYDCSGIRAWCGCFRTDTTTTACHQTTCSV